MSIIPNVSSLGSLVFTEKNWDLNPDLANNSSWCSSIEELFCKDNPAKAFVLIGCECVFIHSSMSSVNQEFLDFIIAHEEGHLLNQHRHPSPTTSDELDYYAQCEMEADRYALYAVGKAGAEMHMNHLAKSIRNDLDAGKRSWHTEVLLKRLKHMKDLI